MDNQIPITVLMSVYNTNEEYLRASINSILIQTFPNFEFIIIVDSPTDSSLLIVHEYQKKDGRIKVIVNEQNLGLTKSLNIGLREAKGKYIARMDADDISFPERLDIQYNYMETHPETVVLGTRTITYGMDKTTQDICIPDQEVLRIRMMFGNPGVPHPTALIRKEVIDKYNIQYDESIKKSQDYKLWVDVVRYGKIEMLPKVLLMYRVHDKQISAGDPHRKDTFSLKISSEVTSTLVGELSIKDIELIRTMNTSELPNDSVKDLEQFFDRIIQCNQAKKIYDDMKLKRELRYLWLLKALRRFRKHKKIDLFFNKWFSMYQLSIWKYFLYNRSIYNSYKNMIKKVDQYK